MNYPTLEAFYDEDPRRRTSGEADYGCWWQDDRSFPRYRVSYIEATGEVYKLALRPGGDGEVQVLAVVPPDPVEEPRSRSLYYRTLDRILDGWAEHCGPPDGITWVRRQLAAGIGS